MHSNTKTPRPPIEAGIVIQLAELLLGWRIAPGRFIKAGKSWCPQWRFRPFEKPADALQLLDHVDSFSVTSVRKGEYIAKVQVGRRRGETSGEQMARVI